MLLWVFNWALSNLFLLPVEKEIQYTLKPTWKPSNKKGAKLITYLNVMLGPDELFSKAATTV